MERLPNSIQAINECLCGCGDPKLAWQWVLDYLTDCGNRGHPTQGAELIAMYLMAHLELTEHGSSVAFSWLTEAGDEALAFLRQNGADWFERGRWVDSDGVVHGDEPANNRT